MLETIRQFAEERLAATGTSDEVRDRHARYFAEQAVAHWELWDGPGYRAAVDWVDVEFANLRAGFRWAADHADLVTATAIAAHTTMLGFDLQRFEPIGWAEEILAAATAADLPQLPRLYTAAGLCCYTGRPDAAVAYARPAMALQADPRYDPFDPGWSRALAAAVHTHRRRRSRPLRRRSAPASPASPASPTSIGLGMLLYMLPAAGRAEEARAIAAEALSVARAHGNPVWIAFALDGTGRAFADTDPARALDAFRQALVLAQSSGCRSARPASRNEAAGLETVHGDLDRAWSCSTPPSTPTTVPVTTSTWPPCSPTWPCSSTATNNPRPPPPSTAPAPTTSRHRRLGHRTFPPLVEHLRGRARRDRLRRVCRRRGGHGHRPTPCATPATRSNSPALSSACRRR